MQLCHLLEHIMIAFLFIGSMSDLVIAIRVVTVDQKGHGDFTSVQQAIDSVPLYNAKWTRILLRPGIYKEKVRIPKNKSYIVLEGVNMSNTIIQYGSTGQVQESCVLKVSAENFVARNITFKNTYNRPWAATTSPHVFWSPAVVIEADKVAFYQCGFVGVVDTLTDWIGRHYFKSCYIEGAIDFIWGQGQSIYEECTINVKASLLGKQPGFITAQSRERPTDTNGFVFKKCIIEGTGPAYLGRAHRKYSRVLFYQTTIPSLIAPEGWSAWLAAGHEGTVTFAEEMCTGDGANKAKRVKWEKTLTPSELQQLTNETIFINEDGWIEKQP